jgi:hypothetical protein
VSGGGPSYSEDEAREAIAASLTYTEALRRLGRCPTGSARAILRKYAENIWVIPTDHFDPDAARALAFRPERRPLSEILVEHSSYPRGRLKERLYDEGLKRPFCEFCGQGEVWRGRRMALVLDHVNGVRDDNRIENLRIVCPNCNATLETHCGRKNRRPPVDRLCAHCGQTFRPKYERQRYCSRACGQRSGLTGPRPHLRRVERPSYDELCAELANSSFLAVGRKYGVSDNAIRRWLRAYENDRRRDALAEAA